LGANVEGAAVKFSVFLGDGCGSEIGRVGSVGVVSPERTKGEMWNAGDVSSGFSLMAELRVVEPAPKCASELESDFS
jgi:hypothetical protein